MAKKRVHPAGTRPKPGAFTFHSRRAPSDLLAAFPDQNLPTNPPGAPSFGYSTLGKLDTYPPPIVATLFDRGEH